MTFYRIFSAVSPDVGSDWFDDTDNHRIMTADVALLVARGSDFAVWVYPDRHHFRNGADPYAVLTYVNRGLDSDHVRVTDTINGWSDRRSVCMWISPATSANVAYYVGVRVRTLIRRYNAVH